MALLVYVAVEGSVSRDRAMGMFWGDRSGKAARHSLSQTLLQISRDLGFTWIDSGRTHLSIVPGVQIDVAELEACVEAELFEDARSLYNGRFSLGGSFSHELERWEEGTDYRTRRNFRIACRGLIGQHLANGETGNALPVVEHWLRVDELNEDAIRHAIEISAQLGRRTEALERYESYLSRMVDDGREPAPKIVQLIDRVRSGVLAPAVEVRQPLSPLREPTSEDPRGPVARVRGTERQSRSRVVVGAPVVIAVLAVIMLLLSFRDRGGRPNRALVFEIVPPPGLVLSEGIPDAVVSPDGETLLLSGTDSTGATRLWYREQATGETALIPDSENGHSPFWAPDSRRFGFFAERRIWISSIAGGRRPTAARSTFESRGATWTNDDQIIYSPDQQQGLRVLSLSTGVDRPLTTPDTERGEIGHLWPAALPDGQDFVYFVPSPVDSVRGIYRASLDNPSATRLVPSAGNGVVANGHLLFFEGGQLLSIPLEQTPSPTTTPARPLLTDVAADYTYHAAFSVAESGVLVHTPDGLKNHTRFNTYDLSGRPVGRPMPEIRQRNFAVSPDGRLIATQRQQGTSGDIVIIDRATGTTRQLTNSGGQAKFPVWSKDGSRIAYVVEVPGGWALHSALVNSSAPPTVILQSEREPVLTDWDQARGILFARQTASGDFDMYAVAPESGAEVEAVVSGSGHQLGGTISPSGRYLAYTGATGSDPQVFIQGAAEECLPTPLPGVQPHWGETDDSLFFVSADGTIVHVELRLPECPRVVAAEILRRAVPNPTLARNHFDLSIADSLLLVEVAVSEEVPRMMVRLDWRGPSS